MNMWGKWSMFLKLHSSERIGRRGKEPATEHRTWDLRSIAGFHPQASRPSWDPSSTFALKYRSRVCCYPVTASSIKNNPTTERCSGNNWMWQTVFWCLNSVTMTNKAQRWISRFYLTFGMMKKLRHLKRSILQRFYNAARWMQWKH